MIPVSYKVMSNWGRAQYKRLGYQYGYRNVSIIALGSLVWPVGIISLYIGTHQDLLKEPPSWL